MPKSVKLNVLTPKELFYSDDIAQIVITLTDGQAGVMPGFIPGISLISEGPLEIQKDGKWITAVVGEGFMEVSATDIDLFVDYAAWGSEEPKKPTYKESEPQASEQPSSHKEHLLTHASIHRALNRKK